MPSSDPDPLAPDACRSDPSAPCYYLHLKARALNGGRDRLSDRELEFVGVGCSPINTPGWRSAAIASADDLEGVGLSAEVSTTLHALMDIEFLG